MQYLLTNILLPLSLIGSIGFVFWLILKILFQKNAYGAFHKALLSILFVMFLVPIHFLSFPKGTSQTLQPYETAGPPSPVQTSANTTEPTVIVIKKVNETLTTVAQTSPPPNNATTNLSNPPENIDEMPISLYTIATSIWVFVAFCMLFFHTIQYICFKRGLLLHAQKASNNTFALYQATAHTMGIRKAPQLLYNNSVPTPMLIGFFKPYIFISNESLPQSEQKLILAHELTHYKNNDILFKMTAFIINVLHWFNPVAWFLPSITSQVCENHCDEKLSKQLTPATRKLYSMAILHSVKPAKQTLPIACTGLSIPAKKLKARIEKIINFSAPGLFKKAIATGTAIVFCLSMFLVGCSVDNQTSTPEVVTDFSISFPVNDEHLSELNVYTFEQSTVNSSNQTISHTGIDFNATPESEIYAVNSGVIKETGTDILLGNYIIIDHQNGFESLYGHLDSILVTEKQTVMSGDVIAKGVTGSCTLNGHENLHFTLLHNGVNKNPYIYIESDSFYLLHPLQNSFNASVFFSPASELFPGTGTTLDVDAAMPIVAMADGIVIDTGFHEMDGNYVIIDHQNGYKTKYCNASEILVELNDSVFAGDTIARVGMTGEALYPQLNFYLYENDIPIDSFPFLDTNHFSVFTSIETPYDPISPDDESYIGNAMVFPLPTGSFRRSRSFGTGHDGVDLAAPEGTPIYAADSGVVTAATYSDSEGYYITIDHGGNVFTTYAHCNTLTVSVGETVEQGQTIATVGSTGWSTGNHLHFEIQVDGVSVNTAPYIGY